MRVSESICHQLILEAAQHRLAKFARIELTGLSPTTDQLQVLEIASAFRFDPSCYVVRIGDELGWFLDSAGVLKVLTDHTKLA